MDDFADRDSGAAGEPSIDWPKRAVVTAGMPYGNKPLHFGHIGGVFIPADVYARFLRDRIGEENVRFVSGTDCFGSPINEGYRKAVEAGTFEGTISDYVLMNHESQKRDLESFDVSLDIFDGSGIGHAGEVHQFLSDALIEGLYERGALDLRETLQFFDPKANTFLNGRQVHGRCPVQGCKSENAYADECDLGHQYAPEELIAPISSLTGTKPEMRPVKNWYFKLPDYRDFLDGYIRNMEQDPTSRSVVSKTIKEFLEPPLIFVKNDFKEQFESLGDKLPHHVVFEPQDGKKSFVAQFDSIDDRDAARRILEAAQIRFRTSKTLVPFRITGSIDWGVRAPELDDVSGLTVWCWPESLWAPISFTIARNDELGLPKEAWEDFWCSDDSEIFQFIGQDNIYFYGIAQPAMWHALGDRGVFDGPHARPLRQSRLVANHHLLFGKTKASSSGAVKPPSAPELLDHYTPEQLRAHFIALGLDQKTVSFSPKPFDPKLTEEQRADKRVADPALKEGALLTNVFNRLARSCLYEAAKSFEGHIPLQSPSKEASTTLKRSLHDYESQMRSINLHGAMQVADELIRYSNKYWADGIAEAYDLEKQAQAAEELQEQDAQQRAARMREDALHIKERVLSDSSYLLAGCILLMHPIVPKGCDLICEYMMFDPAKAFDWTRPWDGIAEICDSSEIEAGAHKVKELPPRFDFFRKHESQF